MIPVLNTFVRDLRWGVSDTLVVAHRNLLRYVRLPQLLAFSTIQPVMFVLLFAYVFGGAIDVGEIDYIDFLLPGILVQAVLFGSMQTGIGIADDLSKGIVDRFRSLPMSRSAVLSGRILADAVRNGLVVLLMLAVGAAIGFRFHSGVLDAAGVVFLAVLFGMVFSWLSALAGIIAGEPESAQVASFIWTFPLVFVSSVFVPVGTMPDWMEAFADISPVTLTVDSMRALALGGEVGDSLWQSLLWMLALLGVFVPLAIWRYERTV